jgi:cellulose synthase/poly-beta-1,6-N-acetylglucosamine synthase-like glycosyltransferase
MELQVVFFSTLLAFFAGYVILHVYILGGLRRLSLVPNPHLVQLSIIVAARNEEKGIASCVNALLQQNYPKELFEVIVVNDRSEDRTAEIVADLQYGNPNLHLMTITELFDDMPPKKNALRRGIESSRFDILVFTDADSIVPPGWLSGIAQAFSEDVDVVAGYSPFQLETKSLGADFLRYEELKNSIGAAAAIGWQRPYMCTGRSFAYRKEVYLAVNGFESIKHSISGDDDLFIQRVISPLLQLRFSLRHPQPFASSSISEHDISQPESIIPFE